MKPLSLLVRFPAMLLFVNSLPAPADEGMWLYNDPPRKILRERYQFEPSNEWLEHLQRASVRFNSGGSGSFVSGDGLIITNHHVGSSDLHKLSDEQHNYLRDGFHARTLAEEKRCLDLELNVLMSIEDVTSSVNAAVRPEMTPDQAFAARRAVMAEIEKESLQKTGLRSDVITLFGGGAYHLYRYKRYTDVRLVFAPEQQAAFFGGDPDNFEYPRYNLDICLFRAYEDNKPARVEHYLKWSNKGVSEGELVFVSGNPGRTSRLSTMDELHYLRDKGFPFSLEGLYRNEVFLRAWSERSDENARRAKENLFGVQNGRKALGGMLAGLLDPQVMNAKAERERQLREAVQANPDLAHSAGAWDQIAAAQQVLASQAKPAAMYEHARGFHSTLFSIARTLLRNAEERPKPNGDRLREFRDSNRESLELDLFSEEPIYDDFEIVKLGDSLTWLAETLGGSDPLVAQALGGKAPRERAAELVKCTRLKDVAARKALYQESAAELAKDEDPMIALARLIDPESRKLRKVEEAQDEVKRQAYREITAAKFQLLGGTQYPDATFTLRLAFGTVRGYESEEKQIPYQTTLAGMYERAAAHHNKEPFDLPPAWEQHKADLDLSTAFNFVSTADIIGGNSGSPVVNRDGEFVGIIFDGNLDSLVLDFVYTDKRARAVAVNCQSIVEALRKIYDAGAIADELGRGAALPQ